MKLLHWLIWWFFYFIFTALLLGSVFSSNCPGKAYRRKSSLPRKMILRKARCEADATFKYSHIPGTSRSENIRGSWAVDCPGRAQCKSNAKSVKKFTFRVRYCSYLSFLNKLNKFIDCLIPYVPPGQWAFGTAQEGRTQCNMIFFEKLLHNNSSNCFLQL